MTFYLKSLPKGSFSSRGMAPHDGEGERNCCLIDLVMA